MIPPWSNTIVLLQHRSNTEVGKPPDASNSFCDGWVYLASVDPEIYRLCRQVTLRNQPANITNPGFPVCTFQGSSSPRIQPYLTINNHAALLATKQFAPALVNLPSVLGMQQAEATAALRAVGLLPGPITQDNHCYDFGGIVLTQNPSAGPHYISPGETFELAVSSGRDKDGKPCKFQ